MRPSRVRYGVVGFALTLAVLAYIQRVAISQAAGPISQDLGLDKAQLGLVFGAFGLSYALFEIPMGLRGDRLGVRRTLTQIVIAWSAFTALTGFAWNFTSMWVIRFLFGAGEAGCFPNLTRMLSQWLPSGERMRAQALMWAFTRWGAAMTPPLVLLAINLVGWRVGFMIFGLMGFIWGLFFLRSFRDDPADHPKVNAAELALLAESRALGEQASGGWLHLLLRPKVFLLVLQYFCFSYVWYFYVTWMPSYLQEAHGQTATATAALSVLPLLLGGLGSLVSGMLPMWVSRRLLAFFGFAATALLLVAVPHMPGVGWVITLMAIASFCSDLTMPISWNACADIGQRYTATVAAAMNMLGNFAGFVAPVVGGFILQANGGDWNLLIYTMGASAVISALCWIFLDPSAEPAEPDVALKPEAA